uniref:Uncharacterized protein n=1 Tax=Gouania willdenowi TaxID=441366 RepID=A0A8C5N7A9_GOUWI
YPYLTFRKICAIGAVGSVVAAPFVLGALGFTSAGIAAGSFAASMMSSAAIANGGGVAAGSLVALLQSAGTLVSLVSSCQIIQSRVTTKNTGTHHTHKKKNYFQTSQCRF